eukprot:TRINITY_DN6181_c0_g1_i2.p2 TRINITY_DN6181_c0_g1~~TRINITY_DN6181_c0_g1_i2.p2  ORF type:complete len:112 (-),score=24.37 TRINITY_DN6181_c0_g1_i2:549-884(-)
MFFFFFFQAEDGIRDAQESRGLGDVYKRQGINAEYGGQPSAPSTTRQRSNQPAQRGAQEHTNKKYIPTAAVSERNAQVWALQRAASRCVRSWRFSERSEQMWALQRLGTGD